MCDFVEYRSNRIGYTTKLIEINENFNVTTTIVHNCNGLYTRSLRVHVA